ncbi:MAG: glycosyltransferase family 2 protein [Syntrophales bacterium LBB04]|nr:glycosyltransferase family 2 protein [Syntrophales bacterium LBB04]
MDKDMESQENKSQISVVIITFNRAQMLADVLASLTEQKRLPDEVVVVDNNSRDDTKQVALSFKDRLNIKYVFEGKQGVSFARNTGIANASGDIIAFIDDDCVAQKEWLYYLELPFLRDPSIGIVGGDILAYRVKGNLIEDFCIAEEMLRVGTFLSKEENPI